MAATLTQERFTGPEWIFERKFDGIRLLAFKQGADVRLFSRNRLPQDIPPIVEAIAALPVRDAILDGEVTWDRYSGYHVFDVMWFNGRDVTKLPLAERQALLKSLPWRAPLGIRPPASSRARRLCSKSRCSIAKACWLVEHPSRLLTSNFCFVRPIGSRVPRLQFGARSSVTVRPSSSFFCPRFCPRRIV